MHSLATWCRHCFKCHNSARASSTFLFACKIYFVRMPLIELHNELLMISSATGAFHALPVANKSVSSLLCLQGACWLLVAVSAQRRQWQRPWCSRGCSAAAPGQLPSLLLVLSSILSWSRPQVLGGKLGAGRRNAAGCTDTEQRQTERLLLHRPWATLMQQILASVAVGINI